MQKKPNYGLDAPAVVKKMALIGSLLLVIALSLTFLLPSRWWAYGIVGLAYMLVFSFAFPAISIPLGSLFLKFRERDWLFDHVPLQGNERVLDVGCGHGLLLISAAKRLKSSTAEGLDLWVQADQANNTRDAALENARIEGVEDKVEIHNGDMRNMPFPDETFDVITSSWAIHNIYNAKERESALSEITRVLKTGGRIAILDIDHTPSYRDFFLSKNLQDVKLLGPRYTFGNKTFLVLATK